MGNVLTAFENLCPFSGQPPVKILFLGLDGAGKTSILYRLKCNEAVPATPTIGFNVETIRIARNVSFTIWDVRGDSKISPLWKHYFPGCKGVVFIVDASDPSRLSEAREELDWILKSDEITGLPFVLLVNKQDLPEAATPSDVAKKLGVDKVKDRKVHVQGTSALVGEGLFEAMRELGTMIHDIHNTCGF